MPQLLRDILYVIETFYNYAREDGNKATLTCRELKQLIQGEFGDILQPSVIHAVERKLDLLDIDSDGNITFEEFILAIFNLLNLCYLDIQSLLNSESIPMSKSGVKPDDVDLQTINRPCQMTEGILPKQDKEQLPSGKESLAQLSPEEKEKDEYNRTEKQGDAKTSKLPGESSGIDVPRNQCLVEDEQRQERPQGVDTRGSNEVQLETNKPTAGSRHSGSSTKQVGQDKQIPGERNKLVREQSDQETRQNFGGKGGNLGIQSSLQEATTQKPLEDQEVDLEMDVKEYNKTQALQRKDDFRSEHIGPEQTFPQKSCLTQKLTQPEDRIKEDETGEAKRTPSETKNLVEGTDTVSEIQDPPPQETKKLSIQGDSRSASEAADVRAKRKEGRDPGVCGIAEQRESESKTQPLALADQTQKNQKLQESSKERDTQKCSMTQELSLQGRDESHPGIERAAVPGEEARFAEESKAETLMSGENVLVAAEISGPREQKQELTPVENKSGRENKRVGQTSDKPVHEGSGYQGQESKATVKNERSYKTCSSPISKDRDSSSGTSNLSVQRESQKQVDSFGVSVQESQNSNPDTQEQVILDEENNTQDIVVHSDREEHEQLTEEQRPPVNGKNNLSSGPKGSESVMEPNRHSEGQESIEEGENLKSLQMETPSALEKDFTDQLPVIECPAKEGSRKEIQVLNASSGKEEGETRNTQEILVKSLDENKSASPKTYLETQEPVTWKEKESPHEPAVEEDVQQESVNKGHNSVSQSDPKDLTQDKGSFSVEREAVCSNPLYMYLQENVLQQIDTTQGQNQALSVKSSSPDNPSDLSLTGDSQASQQCTRQLLDEGQEDMQQTAFTQAPEDKQGLIERSQYHKEK